MKASIRLVLALAAACAAAAAQADITIGVSIPLTGPTSALGIPSKNGIALWPTSIAGEKLNVIILDDATDPTVAVKNTRRFITEDKVDLIVGSAATPLAAAMSDVAAEGQTVQLMLSPVNLPPGKGAWSFRMPQSTAVMAIPIVEHWKKTGVKTYGFLGYSDAYGEAWLADIQPLAEKAGIKLIATERFARPDTSITGQALKLVAANPDAILIGAAGAGAGMPQSELRDRGYKGLIYQTHGAASMDFIRIAGKAAEGVLMASGPVMSPETQPDSALTKKPGLALNTAYEAKYGPNSRSQFAGHSYDAFEVLKRVVPVALKTAKPGTPEFREALRVALMSEKEIAASQGVYNFTEKDRYGLDDRSRIILTVKDGKYVPAK